MPSISILRLLALTGYVVTRVLAATCEVAGGTSDDGPAIKAALASCNNGGTVVLDKSYTLATVLQTTDLNNVAIQLSGTITLNPGTVFVVRDSSTEAEANENRYLVLEVQWGGFDVPECLHGVDYWRFWYPYLWRWNIQWKWRQ